MAPSLSIVVPAYNESASLRETVDDLRGGLVDRGRTGTVGTFEIILVENGSRDDTPGVADALAAERSDVRVRHLPHADYGAAMRTGVLAAESELVACFDADHYDLGFLDRAIIRIGEADIVLGSKRAAGSADSRPWPRRLVTAGFAHVLRLGFGLEVTDTHGMKLLRRESTVPLVPRCRFDADLFDTELVVRAVRSGLTVVELPVTVAERRPPRTSIWTRIPRTLVGLARLRLALAVESRYHSSS